MKSTATEKLMLVPGDKEGFAHQVKLRQTNVTLVIGVKFKQPSSWHLYRSNMQDYL